MENTIVIREEKLREVIFDFLGIDEGTEKLAGEIKRHAAILFNPSELGKIVDDLNKSEQLRWNNE